MDLTSFSDDVLKQELKRREEIVEKQRREDLARQQQIIIDNVDSLLNLVPEHDRTSCNDTDMNNANSFRCKRCLLLQLKRDGYMNRPFTIELFLNKVE